MSIRETLMQSVKWCDQYHSQTLGICRIVILHLENFGASCLKVLALDFWLTECRILSGT